MAMMRLQPSLVLSIAGSLAMHGGVASLLLAAVPPAASIATSPSIGASLIHISSDIAMQDALSAYEQRNSTDSAKQSGHSPDTAATSETSEAAVPIDLDALIADNPAAEPQISLVRADENAKTRSAQDLNLDDIASNLALNRDESAADGNMPVESQAPLRDFESAIDTGDVHETQMPHQSDDLVEAAETWSADPLAEQPKQLAMASRETETNPKSDTAAPEPLKRTVPEFEYKQSDIDVPDLNFESLNDGARPTSPATEEHGMPEPFDSNAADADFETALDNHMPLYLPADVESGFDSADSIDSTDSQHKHNESISEQDRVDSLVQFTDDFEVRRVIDEATEFDTGNQIAALGPLTEIFIDDFETRWSSAQKQDTLWQHEPKSGDADHETAMANDLPNRRPVNAETEFDRAQAPNESGTKRQDAEADAAMQQETGVSISNRQSDGEIAPADPKPLLAMVAAAAESVLSEQRPTRVQLADDFEVRHALDEISDLDAEHQVTGLQAPIESLVDDFETRWPLPESSENSAKTAASVKTAPSNPEPAVQRPVQSLRSNIADAASDSPDYPAPAATGRRASSQTAADSTGKDSAAIAMEHRISNAELKSDAADDTTSSGKAAEIAQGTDRPEPAQPARTELASVQSAASGSGWVSPSYTGQAHANRPPRYPRRSRARGEQGSVILEVHVDQSGKPTQIDTFQSSGYPGLDNAAIKSVRKWKFTPASYFGVAAEGVVRIPIRFALVD